MPIEHPAEPDLAFLYGTILTDGGDGAAAPSRNVCIFAGRQIDRSPTGSGVSARLALQVARRQARLGDARRFESCTGAAFTGTALREAPPVGPRKSVIVEVGGIAHVIRREPLPIFVMPTTRCATASYVGSGVSEARRRAWSRSS